MNDNQLNRLSTLVSLFEKCAKMGGTRPFERIQPIVAKELDELLDDINPPKKVKPAPEPKTEPFKAEPDLLHHGRESLDTERRV